MLSERTIQIVKATAPAVAANAEAIKTFNRHVHRDERVDLAMLPVGEGLTLLRVRR